MVKLVQYSSKILRYNVSDIPDNTLVAEAYLTVKATPSTTDAEAEIFKTITSSVSGDGQIIDDGETDHSGILEFYIGPTDTEFLETDRYYYICAKVKLDNDEFYLIEDSIDSCRILEFGISKSS